jgi:hypothetical protein
LKKEKQIDPTMLLEKAKESEYKESYMLLEGTKNYRVGVGAEITPSNNPSFFFEVIVYLCSESDEVDLSILERGLMFLKELEARGFLLSCEDSNCITCQRMVTQEEMAVEYEDIELLIRRTFP